MHSIFVGFYQAVDPFLIFFYRITGVAILDYLIGTFVRAFIAVAHAEEIGRAQV